MGRPMIDFPPNWNQFYSDWKAGTITAVAAMRQLGLKRSTFYRLVKQQEENMKLKNKLLLGGLTAVLLAVMSFSAWKIWVIRSEYHTGEAAYEDISHMISLPRKLPNHSHLLSTNQPGQKHFLMRTTRFGLRWILLHCVRSTLISLHGSTLKERRSTIRLYRERITAII